LGNDSAVSSSVPVPVLALKTVQRVATGSDHSCAVLGERRALACWGSNASGKLGSDVDVAVDGSTSVPITVSGGLTWLETGNSELELTDVQSVSLGTEHSCAVLGSGHLACWGQQSSGRLANGEVAPGGIPEPVIGFNAQMQPVTNARAVALGQLHGCILTGASQVECWGDNSRGQLGRDPQTLSSSSVVLPVPNLQNVTAIAVGAFHTCALSDQRVYCWGGNARLQLGNRARGPNDPDYLPRPLSSLSRVVTLAAGPVHTCATTDTAIYCWGANHRGELGKADLVDTATPVQVSLNDPLSGQVLVAPGDEFTCALVGSSGTACWGSDAYGELGRARTDYDPQPIPALIQPLKI
jgi:alpha-tubulin suppressor-like RCC1 family protein